MNTLRKARRTSSNNHTSHNLHHPYATPLHRPTAGATIHPISLLHTTATTTSVATESSSHLLISQSGLTGRSASPHQLSNDELSPENKHLLAALILMGHQIPSLMISYRPTIQTLYGRGGGVSTNAYKSMLAHPNAIMHYASSTTADGPIIVWLCMPWEFTSQNVTKFQRLGTSTGCNVLAASDSGWRLMSPTYPQRFGTSCSRSCSSSEPHHCF